MNCPSSKIFSLEIIIGKQAEGLERGEAPRGGMKEELHQKVGRVRVGTQNAQRSERHVLGYAECFGIQANIVDIRVRAMCVLYKASTHPIFNSPRSRVVLAI